MMLTDLQSNEKYLYHYTSKKIGLENILTDMKIRFSPYKNTNDPKESHNFSYLGKNASHHTLHEITKLNIYFRNKLEVNTKLLCFSEDSSESVLNKQYNQIGDGFSIGRGFSRVRLWANCAENHAGMCFIFDKESLISTVKETFKKHSKNIIYGNVHYGDVETLATALQVDYDRSEEIGLEAYFKEFFKEKASSIFFYKTLDWADEEEYRILIFNISNDYLYVPIENSLRGIVVGSTFPHIYYPILWNLQEKKGIEFGRINWFNGLPAVVDQSIVG